MKRIMMDGEPVLDFEDWGTHVKVASPWTEAEGGKETRKIWVGSPDKWGATLSRYREKGATVVDMDGHFIGTDVERPLAHAGVPAAATAEKDPEFSVTETAPENKAEAEAEIGGAKLRQLDVDYLNELIRDYGLDEVLLEITASETLNEVLSELVFMHGLHVCVAELADFCKDMSETASGKKLEKAWAKAGVILEAGASHLPVELP